MFSYRIIIHFNLLKDFGLGVIFGFKCAFLQPFRFNIAETRLHKSIISPAQPAISFYMNGNFSYRIPFKDKLGSQILFLQTHAEQATGTTAIAKPAELFRYSNLNLNNFFIV